MNILLFHATPGRAFLFRSGQLPDGEGDGSAVSCQEAERFTGREVVLLVTTCLSKYCETVSAPMPESLISDALPQSVPSSTAMARMRDHVNAHQHRLPGAPMHHTSSTPFVTNDLVGGGSCPVTAVTASAGGADDSHAHGVLTLYGIRDSSRESSATSSGCTPSSMDGRP